MRRIALLLGLLLATSMARADDVRVDILQKKIADLEAQATDDQKDLDVERNKTNAMSAKALQLEGQLEDALNKLKGLDAANERLAALEKELAAAKDRIAELEKELTAARDRISTLEKELAAEREKSAGLEKRVGELEAKNSDLLRQNGGLEATVAATKEALAELERRKAEADKRVAEFKALLAKFKALIDAGKLKVKIIDGRMVVELATDVLFSSGSAQLSSDGKKAIVEVAQVLETLADRKFQIEGHTDNVPISTEQFPSNWELAAARAITVVKTMLQSGMPPARISAASYADVRPAQPNDTKEGKKANRRIEITLQPDLSSLPGFDELNKVSGSN